MPIKRFVREHNMKKKPPPDGSAAKKKKPPKQFKRTSTKKKRIPKGARPSCPVVKKKPPAHTVIPIRNLGKPVRGAPLSRVQKDHLVKWCGSGQYRDSCRASTWEGECFLTESDPIPKLATMEPMRPQDKLGAQAHSSCLHLTRVRTRGQLEAVDARFAVPQQDQPSNSFSLALFLRQNAKNSKTQSRDAILEVAKQPEKFLGSLEGVAMLGSKAASTHDKYWTLLAQIEKYWQKTFPTMLVHNSFYATALSPIGERLFCAFLLWKAYPKKITKDYLTQFRTAMNYLRRACNTEPWGRGSLSSQMIASIGKYMCKRSKGTRAIPYKILRILFTFLEKHASQDDYEIFLFAFCCASRASEIVKLETSHFSFVDDSWEDTPFVRVKFFNTKTHNRTLDDHHLVTFYKKNNENVVCPYRLAKSLVLKAQRRGTRYVGNFGQAKNASYDSRSYYFYKWFRNLKHSFGAYLKEHQMPYDTSQWRFHSIRTTFVGLLHKWGLSWTQIQVRTGHRFDSESTRQVYATNALLTQGFDKTFDNVVQTNEQAREIFTIPSKQPEALRGTGSTFAINALVRPGFDSGRDQTLTKPIERDALDGFDYTETHSKAELDESRHEERYSADYFVRRPPPTLDTQLQSVAQGNSFDPRGMVENLISNPLPNTIRTRRKVGSQCVAQPRVDQRPHWEDTTTNVSEPLRPAPAKQGKRRGALKPTPKGWRPWIQETPTKHAVRTGRTPPGTHDSARRVKRKLNSFSLGIPQSDISFDFSSENLVNYIEPDPLYDVTSPEPSEDEPWNPETDFEI